MSEFSPGWFNEGLISGQRYPYLKKIVFSFSHFKPLITNLEVLGEKDSAMVM